MPKSKNKRIRIHIEGHTYLITPAQLTLFTHLRELKLTPKFEYRFCADRQWRFDIAIPDSRLAFECNGGGWTGGHRRGKAIDDENEKYNRAQLGGWRVIVFTNGYVLDGSAKKFLKEYL